MPIYEEKLICPLSVRFTQEHIRTTFRDGRVVEETTAEISNRPGTADYDLILHAPFPAIEIIRYSPHSHRSGSNEEKEDKGEHWFTLDNRRLYCLQHAAVSHWPLRVGVAVQILYAEPGSVRRKSDSTVCGRSVSIAHSSRDVPIGRWDWRCGLPQQPDHEEALAAVRTDDLKASVFELANSSEEPELLMDPVRRALLWAEMQPVVCGTGLSSSAAARSATPSTAADSGTSSDGESEQRTPRGQQVPSTSSKYDRLVVAATIEIETQLMAAGNNGYVSMPNWRETYQSSLGNLRVFLENQPNKFLVSRRPGGGFRVNMVKVLHTVPDVFENDMAVGDDTDDIIANAVWEIQNALNQPGSHGFVWVQDWEWRYQPDLGSLRRFVESRPEFSVILGWNRGFRVEQKYPKRTSSRVEHTKRTQLY